MLQSCLIHIPLRSRIGGERSHDRAIGWSFLLVHFPLTSDIVKIVPTD